MTAIVVLWTALFFVGTAFSIWNLVENYQDLFALWEYDLNGDAQGTVRISIGSEWIRLTELIAGDLAGLSALFHVFEHSILVLLFILPIGLTINTIRGVQYRVRFSQAHRLRRQRQRRESDDGGSEHPTV